MVWNKQESRRKYWATRSSVRLFARTAHSFACSGLLASLAPSAELTRSLARSLRSLPRSWESESLMSQNDPVLSHSGMICDATRAMQLLWAWRGCGRKCAYGWYVFLNLYCFHHIPLSQPYFHWLVGFRCGLGVSVRRSIGRRLVSPLHLTCVRQVKYWKTLLMHMSQVLKKEHQEHETMPQEEPNWQIHKQIARTHLMPELWTLSDFFFFSDFFSNSHDFFPPHLL